LVYLDNAATTQKPRAVIGALEQFFTSFNANIDRGVHYLSGIATDHYAYARARVAKRLNAAKPEEVIFTRGATEAVNLVAASWGGAFLKAGDEILISGMEHHANIVPWQMIAAAKGAVLKVAPITAEGALDLPALESLLNERTAMVAVSHMSNVLGTVNPAKEIVKLVRAKTRAKVLLDGAQAFAHMRVDVRDLDCDFYVFSAHKVYGPTGIGALYGKAAILESMPPYQTGGDMVLKVSFEKTTFRAPPQRFEAGTPAIAEAFALTAALDYLDSWDWDAVHAHEQDLLTYATQLLEAIPGVRIYGHAPGKGAVVSFTLEGVHPHDVGTILDSKGVAIRAGHHCAQPLMGLLGVNATARASFALYNTRAEVDVLADAVAGVSKMFNA